MLSSPLGSCKVVQRCWTSVRAVLVLSLLSLAMVGPASASANGGTAWFVMPGDMRALAGTDIGALDTYDPFDFPSDPWGSWNAGVYHTKDQDGWNGDTGYYFYDIRAPLRSGESKSWLVYYWGLPGRQAIDNTLRLGMSTSGPGVTGRLELVQKPSTVSGGPAVGTVWLTSGQVLLPFYATSDGKNGYGFKFTLTAVPEPSSLLALGMGVLPLAGVLARRRRAG